MNFLFTSLVIFVVSRVCNGQSQSAVRLPSSYKNGVKWALATNYQPLTFLETVTTPEEEGVVYILPAGERGIQNYGLHTYANGHSVQDANPRPTVFSTTELPPTFVSPINKLKDNFASHHDYPLSPVTTEIKASDYQSLQEPITTYNIAHDYLTNLLSKSSSPPKPDVVSTTYTQQVDTKSKIAVPVFNTYTTPKPFRFAVSQTYTPENHIEYSSILSPSIAKTSVPAKNDFLSTTFAQQLDTKSKIVPAVLSFTTPKPFGSIVSQTYTPQHHLDYSSILSPSIARSSVASKNDFVLPDVTTYTTSKPSETVFTKTNRHLNSFEISDLVQNHYENEFVNHEYLSQVKSVVSPTTYKPEIAAKESPSKDSQTLSEDAVVIDAYKYV